MRLSTLLLVLLGGLAIAAPARGAGLQCTTADKSIWLPAAEIKKMLEQHGFANIGAIRPDEGNCYVVQVTDNTGARRTLYLDPTDGALMAME